MRECSIVVYERVCVYERGREREKVYERVCVCYERDRESVL